MIKDLYRKVLEIFTGNILSQAIGLLTLPVLLKLYDSDSVGSYFTYMAIINLLSILTSFQFPTLIVQSKSVDEAKTVYRFATKTVLILSLIFAIVAAIGVRKLHFSNNNLLLIFIALFIGVFSMSLLNLCEALMSRLKRFKQISISRILKSLFLSLFQVLSAFMFSAKGELLILATIIGYSLTSLLIIIFYLPSTKSNFCLSNYKGKFTFLLHNTINTILNTSSSQLIIILLRMYYGTSAAAYYGIAQKVIGIPITFISQSLSTVLYQHLSFIKNELKVLKSAIYKVYKPLVGLYFLSFLLVEIIIGIAMAFGIFNEWESVYYIIFIVSPWLFFMFWTIPLSNLIPILNKQKEAIAYSTSLFVFRILTISICGAMQTSFYTTMIIITLVGIVFNGVYLRFIYNAVKNHDNIVKGQNDEF